MWAVNPISSDDMSHDFELSGSVIKTSMTSGRKKIEFVVAVIILMICKTKKIINNCNKIEINK